MPRHLKTGGRDGQVGAGFKPAPPRWQTLVNKYYFLKNFSEQSPSTRKGRFANRPYKQITFRSRGPAAISLGLLLIKKGRPQGLPFRCNREAKASAFERVCYSTMVTAHSLAFCTTLLVTLPRRNDLAIPNPRRPMTTVSKPPVVASFRMSSATS